MDTLKRLGFWLIVAAIALTVVGPRVLAPPAEGEDRPGQPLATGLFVTGAISLGLGFLLGLEGRGRCQRCGRRAASGSIFCATHRRELGLATREAAARHSRNNRSW